MFSKEQIWFQWSSDGAHASCASCLHQAQPRTCSAYPESWQGLCQGFPLLWQDMGLSLATRGSPDDSFSHHYQGGWWKFIQLSLCWLLHSFFSMTHSSNSSTGLCVSHLHKTCRFVSAKRYVPWALFEHAFTYGEIEIKQSSEFLVPQEGRTPKNEQFHSVLSLHYVLLDNFHYLEQNLH